MRTAFSGLLLVATVSLLGVVIWRQEQMEKRMSQRINAKIDEIGTQVTDLLQTAIDEIGEVKDRIEAGDDEEETLSKLTALSTKLEEAKTTVESISDVTAEEPNPVEDEETPTDEG